MEAIILAGGFGTRLKSVVPNLPKPMAPVCGKPFLEILLSSLSSYNFKRVIISAGYMSEVIVSHFGYRFNNIELTYVIEEKPLGTGGAIAASLNHCSQDHAYVLNGDTFIDLEYNEIETQWNKEHLPIIVTKEVSDTFRYGAVIINGNKVVGFSEKGISGYGLINAGCYVLPSNFFKNHDMAESFSLECDFLQKFHNRLNLTHFKTNGHFIDIGIPEDFNRAQIELQRFV